MTATPWTLPTGGAAASLTRRGPRDWNADHIAVHTTGTPYQVTAIAIADGVGDNVTAAKCAEIAAVVTAAAAAQTESAYTGVGTARNAVRQFFPQDSEKQIATATIVTAVISDRGVDIAWAGDSVVFALDSDGVLHLLTEPHHPLWPTPANITEGRIRERFVWTSEPADQETSLRLSLRWLLVTSDGLTHRLTPEEITQLLATADTPQTACELLADAAENAYTRDNVTLAVVDLASVAESR